jgi:hypothetical protein
MTASLTLYDGLLIVAAAGIGVAAWRNRQTSGARSLAVIVIGVVVSALATLLVRISVTYETALLWNRVFYVGWSLIPVCLLVFTLEFTDREQYVTPRTLAALSVVPMVSVLAVWTNDAHHLFWTAATPVPELRDDVFDSGVSTSGDGTGLGLSIVKQIVDAHG